MFGWYPLIAALHSWNECSCNKLCDAAGFHAYPKATLERYPEIVPKIRRFHEDPLVLPDAWTLVRMRGRNQSAALPSAAHSWVKIIHQTWKTNATVPKMLSTLAASWRVMHPDWKYRLWDDKANRKLIQQHYPWFLSTYDAYDLPIKRVDAVRVFYLHRFGGVYADLDTICLKSFEALLAQHAQATVLLGFMGQSNWDQGYSEQVPNALMISKPGAPFWLDVMAEMFRRHNCWKPEFDTGPGLITYVAKAYATRAGSAVVVLDSSHFYAIDWRRKRHLYNKSNPYSNRVDLIIRAAANLSVAMDSNNTVSTVAVMHEVARNEIARVSGINLKGAVSLQLWFHTWGWRSQYV